MSFDDASVKYLITKGFINGRDTSLRPVYAAFIAASAQRELLCLKEFFSYDPIDSNLAWNDFLAMLDNPSAKQEPKSVLAGYEKEFHNFADIQRTFECGRGRMDSKDIERKITYFCSDVLDLSVITFIEMTNVAEDDLLSLMPFLKEKFEEREKAESSNEGGESDDDLDGEELMAKLKDGDEDIFISCEAVLDPIAGVAINDLMIGDMIACKLPETSALHDMFVNQHPGFDGVIEGEISGMKLNEYGTAVVALKLADGMSGAIKLSGKVRIKRLSHSEAPRKNEPSRASFEIIFAAAGIVMFLIVMAALLYALE